MPGLRLFAAERGRDGVVRTRRLRDACEAKVTADVPRNQDASFGRYGHGLGPIERANRLGEVAGHDTDARVAADVRAETAIYTPVGQMPHQDHIGTADNAALDDLSIALKRKRA